MAEKATDGTLKENQYYSIQCGHFEWSLKVNCSRTVDVLSLLLRDLPLLIFLASNIGPTFVLYGSGPLNWTRRHGHYLNSSPTYGLSDTTGGGKSIYSDMLHCHFSNSTGDIRIGFLGDRDMHHCQLLDLTCDIGTPYPEPLL